MKTKFYVWDQNNYGGWFHLTEDISHCMVIEATSLNHAKATLKDLGVDLKSHLRWSEEPDVFDSILNTKVFEIPLEDFILDINTKFLKDYKVTIHYYDGYKERISI